MKDKIKSWLQKTGYPLELFVHQAVLSKNYICEKSEIYLDVETGDAREIDLVAYFNASNGEANYCYEIALVIECKKSDKPLIVLSSDNEKCMRYEHLFNHDDYEGTHMGNGAAYINLHGLSTEERKEKAGQFSELVYSGYSIVPGFDKSDANIYKGIMGLAKANEYYRQEYQSLEKQEKDEQWYRMQLPILVVDAPLFLAHLDEGGELFVETTNWASLLIRMPWVIDGHGANRLCNIQVVQKEYFHEFLDEVNKFHTHLLSSNAVLFKDHT